MESLAPSKSTDYSPAQLTKGLKAILHPTTLAIDTDISYKQENRSLFYRLLAGNLVGYFLSVTIVSVFLGIWLLIKNYSVITGFSLLKTITFSFEKILPLFSQVIFSLLVISLLLMGSFYIYSIIQHYLFDSHTKTGGKLYGIIITFASGYFLFTLGRASTNLWHKPLLYISMRLSELLAFTYEKLSGFSYDVSLGLLLIIMVIFFVISQKLFRPPTAYSKKRSHSAIADGMPLLLSMLQAVTIVGIILIVNTLLLGIILAITIKKTLLFYYLILFLGLGIAYLTQELFILKNWKRPISLGMRLSLAEMYIFICLALEGTAIKLIQLLA